MSRKSQVSKIDRTMAHKIATDPLWAETQKVLTISTHWFQLLPAKSKRRFIFYKWKTIGTAIDRLKAMLWASRSRMLIIPSGGWRCKHLKARGYKAWRSIFSRILWRSGQARLFAIPRYCFLHRRILDYKAPFLKPDHWTKPADVCNYLIANRDERDSEWVGNRNILDRLKEHNCRPDLVLSGTRTVLACPAKGQHWKINTSVSILMKCLLSWKNERRSLQNWEFRCAQAIMK